MFSFPADIANGRKFNDLILQKKRHTNSEFKNRVL